MTHIETWTNCVSSVEKMHSFIDGLETRSPFETYTNHISFLWTLSPFLILWIYVNEIFTCTHQKKAVSDELPFWKFVIVFFVFFIHFSRNVTLVLWQSMDILKVVLAMLLVFRRFLTRTLFLYEIPFFHRLAFVRRRAAWRARMNLFSLIIILI